MADDIDQDTIELENAAMSYIIHGTTQNTKHYLPSKKSLQPSQDTATGELDIWPAFASKSVSNATIPTHPEDIANFNKQTASLPKPKFLVALERYVQKEIITLESTAEDPSELRLQAFREVFEYLIEDFKTYKPLLAQIKNEYERNLSKCKEKIRELEPLKALLVTVSERCDQKIQKIREEEQHEIKDLKRNRMELLRYIDSTKEKEEALQAQVVKLQEELSIEYRKFRNESDMRKLLIADINDMRHHQEDLKRAAGQGTGSEEDDPIKMKLSLKVAKEDLTRVTEQLIRIQADYGDVVPRRDFVILEAKHNELVETYEKRNAEYEQVHEELTVLLDEHKHVLSERDQYSDELAKLSRSATPRPSWNKCNKVAYMGSDEWKSTTKGLSSEKILEVLIGDIEARPKPGPDTFQGLGTSDDIPKHMRYDGDVRNRKFTTQETSKLVTEIWAGKTASDEALGSRQNLSDYVYAHFKQKLSGLEDEALLENLTYEHCYSLDDGLKMGVHLEIPKIIFFHSALTGFSTEAFYYHHMDVVKRLMAMIAPDPSEAEPIPDVEPGSITVTTFLDALNICYPLKEDEKITELFDSALAELGVNAQEAVYINCAPLFNEDDEGRTGPFLNLLRTQENDEIKSFNDGLSEELGEVEQVSVFQVRSAMMIVDPALKQPGMFANLVIAFNCTEDELEEVGEVDKGVVLDRLYKHAVRRIGAPSPIK